MTAPARTEQRYGIPPHLDRLCVDAAIFPPGNTPLEEALAAHVAHSTSPYRAFLGPFILSADRLEEFAPLAAELPDHSLWFALTVPSPDVLGEALRRAVAMPAVWLAGAEVALPADADPRQVPRQLAAALDHAGVLTTEVYVEVPRDDRRPDVLDALADSDFDAKLRIGGHPDPDSHAHTPIAPAPGDLQITDTQLADTVIAAVSRHLPFMASGALPPAFPAVRIENEHYWDGGIVSNTPLQYLLEQEVLQDTLVFQVDLFSARGPLPRDMGDVLSRQKDITYSSRTRNTTDMFRRVHILKLKLRDALLRLGPEKLSEQDRIFLASIADVPQINIVQLIYQQNSYEGHARDYEFSAASMRDHWEAGHADTVKTLRHRKWLEIPSESEGMTAHDVHREDPA